MAKICILGGTGLLGASLVPSLCDLGHKVVCFSRTNNAENNMIVDYFHNGSLERALDACNPSFVINLVALTNVDECEENPNLAYCANVRVVESLSGWIRNNNNCHLIQISTDHVYDGTGPHHEEQVEFINYYGFSKYAGELAASLVPSTILRTNFFGKSLCVTKKSFSDWAFYSLLNGDCIDVFTDVLFSPLSLHSLTEYINIVISKPLLGTFNLGSSGGFSKAKFVYTLADVFGFSTKNITCALFKNSDLRAPRPTDMRMNCLKFQSAYGLSEMPTLESEINLIKGDYIHEIG